MQPTNPEPPVTVSPPIVSSPPPAIAPQPQVSPSTAVSAPAMEYAKVRTRLLAAIVDAVILGLVSSVFGVMTSLVGISSEAVNNPSGAQTFFAANLVVNLILNLLNMSYFVLFTGLKGQTPGKMLMKIKVVKSDTLEVPGILSAFLREIVGKFVSSIVLGIGYFVAIKDPKKQTWHDKIANTVVIHV